MAFPADTEVLGEGPWRVTHSSRGAESAAGMSVPGEGKVGSSPDR